MTSVNLFTTISGSKAIKGKVAKMKLVDRLKDFMDECNSCQGEFCTNFGPVCTNMLFQGYLALFLNIV